MEQKLDFIEKEIQKFIFFIETLMKISSKITSVNFENSVNEIDEKIRDVFEFSIFSLQHLTNDEFLFKLNKIPNEQLDKLLIVFSEIIEIDKQNKFIELKNKCLVLIEYLDENSDDFSVFRMDFKNRCKSNY